MTTHAPAATTEAKSALRMSVLSSFEDALPLRESWDALVVELGASAHLLHDACAVWWSHYGSGRELRVLAFHEGERLVGVLPMYVRRAWLGPVWLKIAGIVGSDSTLIVHDLPIAQRSAVLVWTAAVRHLLEEAGCDAVRIGPVSGRTPQDVAVREAVAALGDRAALARDVLVGPHTVFHLPGTFEEYLASLDKNHRGNYRRSVQGLQRTFDLDRGVIASPEAIDAEFPVFKRMHDLQWKAENRLGHFGDWPRSESYHRELVRAHAPNGRAHLVRIAANREPVSYQLCYSAGRSLAWFLPARTSDPAFERYSLGRMGLIQMIEFAISAGFTQIEGGVGHYDYKLQLGGTEHPVRSLVVTAPGAWTRRRLDGYARLADALDLFYYRGWFQRIAPRLPLPRTPLAKTWIRSRL